MTRFHRLARPTALAERDGHMELPPRRVDSAEGPARCDYCIVTETFPPEINGAAMTLGRLAQGLRARGHGVSIVRPRRADLDGRHPVGEPPQMLVPGAPVPGYRGVRVGWPACRRLQARWRARRPDAVYVATPGPLGWAAVRAARRLGIPVFSGFHTNFPGYARHYRAGWLTRSIVVWLRSFHNRTRGTLVPSADLLARLREAGFENLALLGRGVDHDLFSPARRQATLRARWGVSSEGLAALYVGRIAAEKNVGLAIEAYRAMQWMGPVERLVVVGDGPLRAALERAHPDVLFCGTQTGLALAEHYASADVFLFPSETETFGNVVLEAMASGLVVVAYDYAAAHAHLRPSEAGMVVPYGDAPAFVEAAVAVGLTTPSSLAHMRELARAHACWLDWDAVVGRFEAFLAGVGAALEPVTSRQGPRIGGAAVRAGAGAI
jgi:glycosyltransferase involved in cell wall biosynthesis